LVVFNLLQVSKDESTRNNNARVPSYCFRAYYCMILLFSDEKRLESLASLFLRQQSVRYCSYLSK